MAFNFTARRRRALERARQARRRISGRLEARSGAYSALMRRLGTSQRTTGSGGRGGRRGGGRSVTQRRINYGPQNGRAGRRGGGVAVTRRRLTYGPQSRGRRSALGNLTSYRASRMTGTRQTRLRTAYNYARRVLGRR